MEEIWKNVDGYEGYQVSNLGRIRTYNKKTYTSKHGERHWKNKILKPKVGKDKCLRVELWKNGKHKTYLLHRLVANAFLENKINTNLTINHKDGNRLNNCVSNLEWITRADNIRHAFNNGLMPYNKIKIIYKEKGYILICRSMTEASKLIHKNHGYISSKLKKGIFEDANYKWEVL